MNDRELLELAAKAAGYIVVDRSAPVSMYVQSDGCKGGVFWNPLADDGDALRLAVKLDMQIWRNTGNTVSGMPPSAGFWNRDKVDLAPDPYAATRRAIVRAAAEIGKEKK